ncbi:MAG: adenosylhomocysteinase [Clostridiales bacterium]|nr:adenosylhomocysteinase [Clostridiales bacterium]
MLYDIADISLAAGGQDKISWVKSNMPLLRHLEAEFSKNKPFEGLTVALSIHLEAKTAYLCRVLAAGGAKMYITGSNPLSTQDDVAAALAADGLNVYARYGVDSKLYKEHLKKVIEPGPHIIIDDGGDLVNLIHNEYQELLPRVLGGCEETTTGIGRLVAMQAAGKLHFPMICVNNAKCKYLFDNRYGTGQSVWDAINSTTNLIAAGKMVVVAGYGWCCKGVAMRALGLGASLIVTEIDPIKALEAKMDGFKVMPMRDAAALGDIFITVTGCKDVIDTEDFKLMKDGAILCNAGHFNVEINIDSLEAAAVEKKQRRRNIMGYKMADGRWLNLLAEGRLVNLAAGDGHPAEIMDMSFAIQALSAAFLAKNKGLPSGFPLLSDVPQEIDQEVARLLLEFSGLEIDRLTSEQSNYLNSYNL